MDKILYIIPGYGSHAFGPIGDDLAKTSLKRKIIPVPVSIDWEKKIRGKSSFDNYVGQFRAQVKAKPYKKVYVFGFSFGSVIAFLSAEKLKPDVLILCSLSPYFVEDDLPKGDLNWWKKNFTSRPSFDRTKIPAKTEVFILYGSKESDFIARRSIDAHKKIKGSILKVIPGAKHDLSNKRYFGAVKRIIGSL